MQADSIAPAAFAADPASIVREIGSLLPEVLKSEADGDEIRQLGALLMQTPGSTSEDALAFASIAATMLGALLSNSEAVAAMDEATRGSLMQTGGYLVQTVRALEATTGTTFNFSPDPVTP